ncbi:MAG: Holliday junction resolvase RuvX [Alphaproteobacteria bacterium]|nr:MAG: Holliday junction resolvase RuvX [Alphaproteobacteria bacterium]
MIFEDIEQFVGALPAYGALIGLDLGTKTIGLALSDTSRLIASPDVTLKKAKLSTDLENLKKTITAHEVAGIVLGLPRNMDGSEGPRAQSTRAFARNIDGPLGLPILLWDERLSTAAVTRTLLDADASRKRRAEVVDKMAAAYILQGALDRMKHMKADRL